MVKSTALGQFSELLVASNSKNSAKLTKNGETIGQ